jgi:hypothetical protein
MRLTALFSAVVFVASLAGAARPVYAQSLGDLSKQEQERQKNINKPAKVYTNKDLNPPPASSVAPAEPEKPAAAPAPAAPAPDDKKKDAAAKDDAPAKDQKYWSERKKQLDTKLERDKVLADAMQSRINGLTTDFAARSDPAQRAQIERERQRAVAELDSLQKAIKADQKALADFDEEARKASVPPGWLR